MPNQALSALVAATSLFTGITAFANDRPTLAVDVHTCPETIAFTQVQFEEKGIDRLAHVDRYIFAVQAFAQAQRPTITLQLHDTQNGKCRYVSGDSTEVTALISQHIYTEYGEDGVPSREQRSRLMMKMNLEDAEFIVFFKMYTEGRVLKIDDYDNRQTVSTPIAGELPRVGFMRYGLVEYFAQ